MDSTQKGVVMESFNISLLLAWTNCWKTVALQVIWDPMELVWRHCNVTIEGYQKYKIWY